MMLVGFGYLMAFLKCYGLGAVGFTFVITCLTLQAHSHKDRDTLLSTNLNQTPYSPTTIARAPPQQLYLTRLVPHHHQHPRHIVPHNAPHLTPHRARTPPWGSWSAM